MTTKGVLGAPLYFVAALRAGSIERFGLAWSKAVAEPPHSKGSGRVGGGWRLLWGRRRVAALTAMLVFAKFYLYTLTFPSA